jgi:3-methylcrotonyl-CoA carboxylase alpha subunit
VRVDDGVREGDTISPYYDSMVAKLIVHGDTREQALARLDAALAATHIVGLHTNVQFLRHVVATPSFAQGRLDTALIPREAGRLFGQQRVSLAVAAAAVVADVLRAEQALAMPGDPFSQRDGWLSHGERTRRFALSVGGVALPVALDCLHDGALRLRVEGDAPVSGVLFFGDRQGGGMTLNFAGSQHRVFVYKNGALAHVHTESGAIEIEIQDPLAHAGDAPVEGGRLTAPMPGKVVSFAVKPGDVVTRGQALAVMEAMKMEHTIAAPEDGTVSELMYAPGDQVAEGAELLRLARASGQMTE